MSGTVILRRARKGGQPRFWAASSRVTLVCWKPADQEGVVGGIQRGEEPSVLGHCQIPEGQHKPRHGKGQHRHRIKNLPPREPCAHNDICNGNAKHDVHNGRQARVFEAVLNGREGQVVAEGGLEVGKGQLRGQDGIIPIARKCDEHDTKVRKNRKKSDSDKEQSAER